MDKEAEENIEESGDKDNKSSSLGKVVSFLLIVVVGFMIGSIVIKHKPEYFGLSKGTEIIKVETDMLLEEIGKIITLPSDEKPTVATVTDVEKVKDQPFFKNAKNDDKVLIYQKSQKAILYRPSEKKVVEVGSVNINKQPVLEASGSPTPKPTIAPTPKPTQAPIPTGTPTPLP